MLWAFKTVVHALFRIFFTLEYNGVENVPADGPVVIAGNHPSYLDPVLISLPVRRKIRFIAWDRLFKVPLLGQLIRFLGAFPVDITRRDSRAFEQAMEILRNGEPLGIFPEAGRSKQGRMNEMLKTGAARFAIQNRCPLVPVTIAGAYDAWPATRLIPFPRKITVKYHAPISFTEAEYAARAEDPEFPVEITEKLRTKIEQRLVPALKVSERRHELLSQPAWHLRVFETVPFGLFLLALFSAVPKWPLAVPPLLYLAYLIADLWFIPQNRPTKAFRDLAVPLLFAIWHPILISAILPKTQVANFTVTNFPLFWIVVGTLLFPYFWANYYDTQRFIRGLTLCYCVCLGFLVLRPDSTGMSFHATFLAFGFVYALERRPLHWIFSAVGSMTYLAMFAALSVRPWNADLAFFAGIGVAVCAYMRVVKFTAHDGREI